MDFWRQSAIVSRKDKILKHVITEKMGLENSALDDIQSKLLIWYRHVHRMAGNRWPKEVLEWMPQGRRKRGRPRVRRMKGIQDAISQREVKGQWTDRNEWKLGIGRHQWC
jgi:hypothetical protein